MKKAEEPKGEVPRRAGCKGLLKSKRRRDTGAFPRKVPALAGKALMF